MLRHVIDALVNAFGSVSLKVGICYKAEQVIDYFQHHKSPNVNVEFFVCKSDEGAWNHFQRARPLIRGDFITASGDMVALPQAYQNAITLYKREPVDGVITLSSDIYVADVHGVGKVINGTVVDLILPAPPVVEKGYYRDMTIWPGDVRFFNLMDSFPMPKLPMSWVYRKAIKEGRIIAGNVYSQPWLHLAYPQDLNGKVPRGK